MEVIQMKRSLFISVAIILWACLAARAQYMVKGADKQFGLFNYVKAIALYKKGWEKKQTLYTAERLATAYRHIQDYKEAESWSAIAVDMKGSPVVSILDYAKALQSNGKYDQAKQQYKKYMGLMDRTGNVDQLNNWILSCDSAIKWIGNAKADLVENEKTLNSPQSDWAPVGYKGGIVLCSDRSHPNDGLQIEKRPFVKFDNAVLPDKGSYGWTGNSYLRLYLRKNKEDSVKLFLLEAVTNYHMGPVSFSSDGNEVYFALTRIPEKLVGNGKQINTINVEIYSCKKGPEGKWSTPEAFAYNNVNEYSLGDPFLAKGGNMLYFSSNMPGGMGGTDIYACSRAVDGSWGRPVNIKEVNTSGNERSISFDKEDNMYFSSDGRIGMGGLDIYKATPNLGNRKIWDIKNMGYPINSPQDDFSFNPNIGDGKAYFASNRTGGLGGDDIYSFFLQQKTP
jgi:peptidoglycan-associated lipoprotein